MTTLVTGKGRTSGALAKLLHDANRPFIVTTRSGNADGPYNTVKFDLFDEETFANPFKADTSIDRVYLLYPPGRLDALAQLDKFIKFAISKGVKRIVLLSATQVPSQDVPAGGFHKYFTGNGVDYAVLRPTWFIRKFKSWYGLFFSWVLTDWCRKLWYHVCQEHQRTEPDFLGDGGWSPALCLDGRRRASGL